MQYENKFVTKVNWAAVQAEINKRLKKDYDRHYIQTVYRGDLQSSKIKNILDEILPPYRKNRKAA